MLRRTLELAAGRPVLFLYEKLALARDALAAVGAVPWPDAESTVAGAAAAAEAVTADAAAAADAAEAVVTSAAAMAITDAADAALAQARSAATGRRALTPTRPRTLTVPLTTARWLAWP